MQCKVETNAGATRTMWLTMLEQGGRWTATELAEKLEITPSQVDRLTYFMVRSGCATKYKRKGRKNGVAFGVTQSNEVPRGMKLQEVLQATGIRLWE